MDKLDKILELMEKQHKETTDKFTKIEEDINLVKDDLNLVKTDLKWVKEQQKKILRS